MGNKFFEGKEFAVQVIAKGAFVDQPTEGSKPYLVETATVRLNHVALGEWQQAFVFSRDCFETREEWEQYKKAKSSMRQTFKTRVGAAVGFAPGPGKENINVEQVVSEVFAVCWIHEVRREQEGAPC
nr:MAG TPA: hypothetical protein [Caudoviricetes sp.]